MNTTYREFDTDNPSTLPSRSVRIARNSSAGFTLIELLVVISIVALLSTVVLAAVGDSRAKARNTAKNSLVLEYVKALELYRSDSDNDNSYPITTMTPICFGYTSSETCYGNLSGSDSLKTKMQTYLPIDFAHRDTLQTSLGDLRGITYTCSGPTSCSSYTLTWILEKNVTKCANNATQVDEFLGHTYCSYTLN